MQWKKHSLLRVAKISKKLKRGSFLDNTVKRVVFTEFQNALFRFLSSTLCSSIGTQLETKHPPPGECHYFPFNASVHPLLELTKQSSRSRLEFVPLSCCVDTVNTPNITQCQGLTDRTRIPYTDPPVAKPQMNDQLYTEVNQRNR